MKITRTIGIVKSLLSNARGQIFSARNRPLDPDDDLSLTEASVAAKPDGGHRHDEAAGRDPRPAPREDPAAAPRDDALQKAPPAVLDHRDVAPLGAAADAAAARASAAPLDMGEEDDLWHDAIAAADDEDGVDFTACVGDVDVDDDIWPDGGADPDDADDDHDHDDMSDEAAFAFDPLLAPVSPAAPSLRDAVDDWRLDRRAMDLAVLLPFRTTSAAEAALPRIHLLLETFPHAASHGAMRRLAGEGATLSQLERIAEVKANWRDSPDLWLQRRWRPGGVWVAQATDALRDALTWRVAARLLEDRASMQAIDLMHGDWLESWLACGRHGAPERADGDPAFHSFPAWLAAGPDLPERADETRWPYDRYADRRDHRRRSPDIPGYGRLLQGPAPDPWRDANALGRSGATGGGGA